VSVQSFEVANLVALRSRLRVDLVQLTAPTGAPWVLVAAGDLRTYADLVTPAGLRQIARYADALGPDKTHICQGTAPAPRCRRPRWSWTRTGPG
jgi:glycerophosphoryl diester phosphodiesterase